MEPRDQGCLLGCRGGRPSRAEDGLHTPTSSPDLEGSERGHPKALRGAARQQLRG